MPHLRRSKNLADNVAKRGRLKINRATHYKVLFGYNVRGCFGHGYRLLAYDQFRA